MVYECATSGNNERRGLSHLGFVDLVCLSTSEAVTNVASRFLFYSVMVFFLIEQSTMLLESW